MREEYLDGNVRRILLTGFSFFNKYFYNTSEEVAGILDGWRINDKYIVRSHVLPVSLEKLRELYPKIVGEEEPAMILSLGLAPRLGEVALELVAYNAAYYDTPDVEGYRAGLEPIIEGGVNALETRLPVKRIVEQCRYGEMLPIRPSVSIGTYLCNAAGYLAHLYSAKLGVPGGFLHLPPHTDLALKAGLSSHRALWEIVETVRCVIKAALMEA